MINLIKAETYRLFKGKTFYITLFCLLLFCSMSVITQTTGTVGVNTAEIAASFEDWVWSGYNTPNYFVTTLNILQYFFLPIIVAVMGSDFSEKTYRNTLSKGVSRYKYYLAKLLLVLIVCFFYAVIYIAFPTILATLLYGFDGTITTAYLMKLFKLFAVQLLILYTLISIASAVYFITKKSTACTIGYLLITMIIQLVIALIYETSPEIGKILIDYEIFSAMSAIAHGLLNDRLLHYTFLAIIYSSVTSFIGMYLFNKMDLK